MLVSDRWSLAIAKCSLPRWGCFVLYLLLVVVGAIVGEGGLLVCKGALDASVCSFDAETGEPLYLVGWVPRWLPWLYPSMSGVCLAGPQAYYCFAVFFGLCRCRAGRVLFY